ncbi:MAG: hypothetical protein HY856_13940 [Burkholderiales bacterium]|nr:hypothetical protein [Burkholderiales bacterium]
MKSLLFAFAIAVSSLPAMGQAKSETDLTFKDAELLVEYIPGSRSRTRRLTGMFVERPDKVALFVFVDSVGLMRFDAYKVTTEEGVRWALPLMGDPNTSLIAIKN